ncbi:hypothetical protein [Candidatus Pseudomonas adelgestsugas]|uniref:Uncharacterized protein n=1 Tax=Candidatus Pseudomonas adelgestsugas TaxID=1302376 RepID=A0ABX5R8S8_9PSED|nr:hypothetical protein [Candidatus Pseudomonas adelgestsugas]QAX81919.1 hypothetical protein C3B55_00586 [Candidatus Pseudomonas adelgestsugas]
MLLTKDATKSKHKKDFLALTTAMPVEQLTVSDHETCNDQISLMPAIIDRYHFGETAGFN